MASGQEVGIICRPRCLLAGQVGPGLVFHMMVVLVDTTLNLVLTHSDMAQLLKDNGVDDMEKLHHTAVVVQRILGNHGPALDFVRGLGVGVTPY